MRKFLIVALVCGCGVQERPTKVAPPQAPDVTAFAQCLESDHSLSGLEPPQRVDVQPGLIWNAEGPKPGTRTIFRYALGDDVFIYEAAPELVLEARGDQTVSASASSKIARLASALVCDRTAATYAISPFDVVPPPPVQIDPVAFVAHEDTRSTDAYTHGYWYWQTGAVERDGEQFRYSTAELRATLAPRVRVATWLFGDQAAARPEYLCRLAAHEQLHIDINRVALAWLLRQLVALRATSVEQLHAQADAIAATADAWVAREHLRFDAHTCGGPTRAAAPS